MFLIRLDIPFGYCRQKSSGHLIAMTHSNENFCIAANLSEKEMEDLIKKAHVNILPSFNKTGIKIKLLNALFNGRYVVTNAAGVEKNNLESICEIAETESDFKKTISELFQKSFTQERD